MAEMIPVHPIGNCPSSERKVFMALNRGLPGTCKVFHRVAWQSVGGPDERPMDGETDFVIIHPEKGIVCLEVKGGGISCDGQGQWHSKDKNGKKHKIKDPISQAVQSKHTLFRYLKFNECIDGRVNLGHCIAFPDCSYDSRFTRPDVNREILLFSEDLRHIEDRIPQIFDFFQGKSRPISLNESSLQKIHSLLAPSFELRTLRSFLRDAEEEIIRLTDAQFKVLDELARNRRFAICGGAGTGKTLLAREKAVRLANSGMRTLLVCYNRPLADFLTATTVGNKHLSILDFHQLCDQMAKAARIEITEKRDKHFYESEAPNVLLDALAKLPDRRFDAIVIDEAQDFSEEWSVALLMALEDPDVGIVFAFYDDNQRIYDRQNPLLNKLPNRSLSTNLRNTKKIYQLADLYYRGGRFDHDGPAGRKVEFVEAESGRLEETIVKCLKELIEEEEVDPFDIAVLTGRSAEQNFLIKNGKIGPFPVTHNVLQTKKILFETIRRFKGLERPIVILTQLRGTLNDEELLYVGITRARSHLIVISSSQTVRAFRKQIQKLKKA